MSDTYRTFEDVRDTVVRELRSIEQDLLAGIASDEDEGNLMWVEADFTQMLKMVYEQIDVSAGEIMYARGLRPTPGNEDVTSEPVEPTIGVTCSCVGKCNRDCPCMNVDCEDDDCGGSRGCLQGSCNCASYGECD
jgi:hypothetical protein